LRSGCGDINVAVFNCTPAGCTAFSRPTFGAITKDQATKADASSTASAYLEFGHQQMQVYQALRKLVDEFAAKTYSGSIPSEFNTMKCIDLYHSKELDRPVTQLLKTKFEPE